MSAGRIPDNVRIFENNSGVQVYQAFYRDVSGISSTGSTRQEAIKNAVIDHEAWLSSVGAI